MFIWCDIFCWQLGEMWPHRTNPARQERVEGAKEVCRWKLARKCIQEVNVASHNEKPAWQVDIALKQQALSSIRKTFQLAGKKQIASQEAFAVSQKNSGCGSQVGYSQMHLTMCYLVPDKKLVLGMVQVFDTSHSYLAPVCWSVAHIYIKQLWS